MGLWVTLGLCGAQDLELGKRAFDAGDYSEAARLFEKARRGSPACPPLFYLGLARYRLSQLDAALIAFQTAVQCDPKLTAAHIALGEAYLERRNTAEALASFDRALALEPRNPAALRGAASVYLSADANEKAVPLLEALIAVQPSDARAHADLAAAYVATGQRGGEAERQFQEALRLDAHDAGALLGLGSLYLKNARENEAIPLLTKAAAEAPKAYEPPYLLGTAYNRLGRFKEALGALAAAQRLGGNQPEIFYHLARAYGGLGRPEERRAALARFAELSAKAKESVQAQRTSARLLEQAKAAVDSGNLETALQRLEEARELGPANDRLLFRLAGLEYDLGHLDRARNYVQEAISLAPSLWLYHYLLGLIERGAGHRAQARASLETALRLNPAAAEAAQALAALPLQP